MSYVGLHALSIRVLVEIVTAAHTLLPMIRIDLRVFRVVTKIFFFFFPGSSFTQRLPCVLTRIPRIPCIQFCERAAEPLPKDHPDGDPLGVTWSIEACRVRARVKQGVGNSRLPKR